MDTSSDSESGESDPTNRSLKVLPCREDAIELMHNTEINRHGSSSSTQTAFNMLEDDDDADKADEAIALDPQNTNVSHIIPENAIDINILLLGESGVGKSTFINSFANYMKHQDIEAVQNDKLTVLIPARFKIFDKDLKSHLIEVGANEDSNEYLADGAAATQDVKTYIFYVTMGGYNYTFRLIDTPGIGDPRGISQDNKNCDYVLHYLSGLDKIHAICLLLKPTNTRLDVFLNYCVTQILSRLDKSATHNIAFLFTNTRGQNYTPGDTYTSLELLVKKIKETNDVTLPLSKENVFCFDNEAFRFLASIKQGVEFKEGVLEANVQSWSYSYKEIYRLLQYVVNLTPHDPKKTVSINQARKMVLQLAQPLAEIVQLIGDNIYQLDQHAEQLLTEDQTLASLKKNLYMPVVDILVKELPQPVTVCTASQCSTTYQVAGKNKYHYKQRCHNPCYLDNVPAEIVGDPRLIKCVAMNDNVCKECGCRFNVHMHIYYETETFDNKIVDQNVMNNITNKKDAMKQKQILMDEILNRKEELEQEHKQIIRCTALFAHFLKKNAITPVNDSLKEYVKYLIKREENLGPSSDRGTLDYLKNLLQEYEQELTVLNDALKQGVTGSSYIRPEAIEYKIKDLFNLPHFGSKIRQLYALHQSGDLSEHKQSEFVVKESYNISLVGRLRKKVTNFFSHFHVNKSNNAKELEDVRNRNTAVTCSRQEITTFGTNASVNNDENYLYRQFLQYRNEFEQFMKFQQFQSQIGALNNMTFSQDTALVPYQREIQPNASKNGNISNEKENTKPQNENKNPNGNISNGKNKKKNRNNKKNKKN